MNEAEIKRVVQEVLQTERDRLPDDQAVLKTISAILTSFGINDDDRKEIRADFVHLRRWRKSTEQIQKVGTVSAIGIIVSGVLGMLWIGLKTLLGK